LKCKTFIQAFGGKSLCLSSASAARTCINIMIDHATSIIKDIFHILISGMSLWYMPLSILAYATFHFGICHFPFRYMPPSILSYATFHFSICHFPFWHMPLSIVVYATFHFGICHFPFWYMPLSRPWPSGQGGHTLLPWGRAAWVRSPPTPTHKTCLLSAVGDLK
jgi:hypothetical protein